jgi:hypothetical protein
MNFNTTQAAQTANYAGIAMNEFQTAVDINNQQPQAEKITSWFRWLIRIVAVVTGIRKFNPKLLFISYPLPFSCHNFWCLHYTESIAHMYSSWCHTNVCQFVFFSVV